MLTEVKPPVIRAESACLEVNGMNDQFIIVSSITYAFKARDVLERKGYRAFVEREPHRLSDCGCHYIIRIRGLTIDKALDILQKANVRVIGTGRDE